MNRGMGLTATSEGDTPRSGNILHDVTRLYMYSIYAAK